MVLSFRKNSNPVQPIKSYSYLILLDGKPVIICCSNYSFLWFVVDHLLWVSMRNFQLLCPLHCTCPWNGKMYFQSFVFVEIINRNINNVQSYNQSKLFKHIIRVQSWSTINILIGIISLIPTCSAIVHDMKETLNANRAVVIWLNKPFICISRWVNITGYIIILRVHRSWYYFKHTCIIW